MTYVKLLKKHTNFLSLTVDVKFVRSDLLTPLDLSQERGVERAKEHNQNCSNSEKGSV